MENDIKTIPIRITVEKTIRFQRCLDVTPEQLEKIRAGESPLVNSLLEHFDLEVKESLAKESLDPGNQSAGKPGAAGRPDCPGGEAVQPGRHQRGH